MGIETATIVMAAVAAGATVGKTIMNFSAAEAQRHALNLQAKQMQLVHQQKTLANYDQIEKVLAAQTAEMTTRGVAFSSPSFNAIQRATMNIGGKKQRNIDIEGELAQTNIEIEKQNVKNALFAQLFGDVANTAIQAIGVTKKLPKMGE